VSRPLIPGAVDLGNGDNVVQARHELHRAIDFGSDAECAAWARKWGEAALACGERVSALDEDDYWPGVVSVSEKLDACGEQHAALKRALAADPVDLAAARRAEGGIGRALNSIRDLLENDE
jgi:hypothetical protein